MRIKLDLKSTYFKQFGRGKTLTVEARIDDEFLNDKNISFVDFIFDVLKEATIEELKEVGAIE